MPKPVKPTELLSRVTRAAAADDEPAPAGSGAVASAGDDRATAAAGAAPQQRTPAEETAPAPPLPTDAPPLPPAEAEAPTAGSAADTAAKVHPLIRAASTPTDAAGGARVGSAPISAMGASAAVHPRRHSLLPSLLPGASGGGATAGTGWGRLRRLSLEDGPLADRFSAGSGPLVAPPSPAAAKLAESILSRALASDSKLAELPQQDAAPVRLSVRQGSGGMPLPPMPNRSRGNSGGNLAPSQEETQQQPLLSHSPSSSPSPRAEGSGVLSPGGQAQAAVDGDGAQPASPSPALRAAAESPGQQQSGGTASVATRSSSSFDLAAAGAAASLGSVRALVVDDMVVNLKVAVSILKKCGVGSTATADDGEKGAAAASEGEFDVILMARGRATKSPPQGCFCAPLSLLALPSAAFLAPTHLYPPHNPSPCRVRAGHPNAPVGWPRVHPTHPRQRGAPRTPPGVHCGGDGVRLRRAKGGLPGRGHGLVSAKTHIRGGGAGGTLRATCEGGPSGCQLRCWSGTGGTRI